MKHVLLICALLLAGCQGQDGDQPLPDVEPSGGQSPEGMEDPGLTLMGEDACTCVAPAGADGSSCTVEQTGEGATISCGDGTSASVVNGNNGSDGSDGLDGAAASVGAQGPAGPMGPAGPAGADGMSIVGPQGPMGSAGAQGPAGTSVTGPAGPKGDKGDPGDSGADGADGAGITQDRLYNNYSSRIISVAGDTSALWVGCQEGDILLYGGCTAGGNGSQALIINAPLYQPGEPVQGWQCAAGMMGVGDVLQVHVGCLIVE